MKIFKYSIEIVDTQSLAFPRAAIILSVQVQNGRPQIWALVDPGAPVVPRKFALRGTGHDATGMGWAKFIGTFQMHGGDLVFHLFDLGEANA